MTKPGPRVAVDGARGAREQGELGRRATASMGGPVYAQRQGAITAITLNRPRTSNALDPDLVVALKGAIEHAMLDEQTAVIVVRGAGPSFCAGADLRHLLSLAETGGDPRVYLSSIGRCFDQLERGPKPVVAAIQGHAVAGGLELALACDVVIAAEGALLGDGHVRHNLLPGAGSSYRLPRKVGEPLARLLTLTGELLPAESFIASGFVHKVVPSSRLEHEVRTIAETLAASPAVARAKTLLSAPFDATSDASAARELDEFARHWAASDVAVALRRFLGKETR